MKKFILLSFVALIVSGCTAAREQPLTLNMTAEQMLEADPLALCLDSRYYVLPEVDVVIKKRKINCKTILTTAMREAALGSNNVDVCDTWMNSTDAMERSVFNKEKNSRQLDCGSILSAKAQQDSVEAMRRANRIAASQAAQQAFQNQQAINAMNRPRQTTCYGYGCTTY